MKYQVEISSVAEVEMDSAFLRMTQFTSPEVSKRWYADLLKAIASLSRMPRRCPIARENVYSTQEVRQLLYGRGRNLYRILFTVLESDNLSIVRILHVRYAAQQTLGESQEED